jgi:hypothetical protein
MRMLAVSYYSSTSRVSTAEKIAEQQTKLEELNEKDSLALNIYNKPGFHGSFKRAKSPNKRSNDKNNKRSKEKELGKHHSDGNLSAEGDHDNKVHADEEKMPSDNHSNRLDLNELRSSKKSNDIAAEPPNTMRAASPSGRIPSPKRSNRSSSRGTSGNYYGLPSSHLMHILSISIKFTRVIAATTWYLSFVY